MLSRPLIGRFSGFSGVFKTLMVLGLILIFLSMWDWITYRSVISRWMWWSRFRRWWWERLGDRVGGESAGLMNRADERDELGPIANIREDEYERWLKDREEWDGHSMAPRLCRWSRWWFWRCIRRWLVGYGSSL